MDYKLLGIRVSRFSFQNRALHGNEYKLEPVFGKTVEIAEGNVYELKMAFSLHDQEDAKAPYDMALEVIGSFEFKNCSDSETNEFMNSTAVSIVFPYLRSTLSTVMSSLLVPPIILPIIDPQLFFK